MQIHYRPLLTLLTFAAVSTAANATISTTTGSEGATAIVQSSATGSAVQGEVASQANTTLKIPFALLGDYDPTSKSTFGAGVIGISTTGYGVGAEAFGQNPAVVAINAGTGDGLDAVAGTGASAIFASSTQTMPAISVANSNGPGLGITSTKGAEGVNIAVTGGGLGLYASTDASQPTITGLNAFTGQNGFPVGVYGYSKASSGIGVYGRADNPGSIAVEGNSVTGTAVYGMSQSGSGLAGYSQSSFQQAVGGFNGGPVILGAAVGGSNGDLMDLYTSTNGFYSPSLTVTSGSKGTVGARGSDIVLDGDLYVGGVVYGYCNDTYSSTSCGATLTGQQTTAQGTNVRTYDSHTAPSLEDDGVAHLVNGYAHVAIDAAYGSSISTQSEYMVFATPQGDCNGVFVTNKTPAGFDVRELRGGKSSLAIDYRIVARPFGNRAARLALVVKPAPRKLGLPDALRRAPSMLRASTFVAPAALPAHKPLHDLSLVRR